VLVAIDASGVLGYSSFGDFRAPPCYRYTVEHTVHVRADARRRGLGRALVMELPPLARALGKHVMIGGVDGENAGSIAFHRQLGFEEVARLRQVGRKFGRWLDLVFLQLLLDD
jgi:phosphinothricin acetyltransferase